MKTETITVIIPCFNEEEALPVYYQAMQPLSLIHIQMCIRDRVLEQLNKKGDRLQLEENRMQLFSGENLLSEVELPEGGGGGTVEIESITNPEIDEIMKGAE